MTLWLQSLATPFFLAAKNLMLPQNNFVYLLHQTLILKPDRALPMKTSWLQLQRCLQCVYRVCVRALKAHLSVHKPWQVSRSTWMKHGERKERLVLQVKSPLRRWGKHAHAVLCIVTKLLVLWSQSSVTLPRGLPHLPCQQGIMMQSPSEVNVYVYSKLCITEIVF